MKHIVCLFALLLAVAAQAQSAAGSWQKALSGMGVGSSRAVAVKAAHNNLDLEIESHEELCNSQHGQWSVNQSPEDHCEQTYPLNNWRCVATARATCRF